MVIEQIKSFDDYTQKAKEDAALFYFSHDQCNVCKVLKPKVYELLEETFPKIKMYYVNTKATPDVAAQQSIFAVPTLIVYLDGREFIRKSRNIGIEELRLELQRPYSLLFE